MLLCFSLSKLSLYQQPQIYLLIDLNIVLIGLKLLYTTKHPRTSISFSTIAKQHTSAFTCKVYKGGTQYKKVRERGETTVLAFAC